MKHAIGYRKWTATEDAIVVSLFPEFGTARLVEHLSGRTAEAIKQRAKTLGVRAGRRAWTDADDVTLRELYPTHTSSQIAVIMKRSPTTIQWRASIIGLKKRHGKAS